MAKTPKSTKTVRATTPKSVKAAASNAAKTARAKPAERGDLSRKIIQVLPLRVSDGFDEAFLTLEQSALVENFITSPSSTTAIQYDDPSLATVPIANLFKSDSLLPRVNNPTKVKLDLTDVVKLFSTREIKALDRKWKVKIDKSAISRLIRGKATSLLGSDGDNIGVFRVSVASSEEQFAPLPIADEILLLHRDLATFLENPIVPGTRQLPFRINLSEAELLDFLSIGAVKIDVDDKKTLSIVVVADDTTEAKSGLSFRRDIWTPIQIEHLFGVTTKGYLSSSKDLEQAAVDDYNALLSRMRSSLNVTSINATKFAGEHLALMLPWRQSWTFEGETVGVRKQTTTLLPQETRAIKSESSASGSDSSNALAGYVDSLLTSNQEILDSNAAGFVSVGSPLILTKSSGQKTLGIEALDTRSNSFSAFLSDKVTDQSKGEGRSSDQGNISERISKTVANPSSTSLLELTDYKSLNQFKVETTSVPSEMSLGYLIDNPFLSLPLNIDTIMRYQSIFASSLLNKDLEPGFQTIGRVVKQAKVRKFSAGHAVPQIEKTSKLGRNQAAAGAVSDKDIELLKLQRQNLEDRLRAALEIVQRTALELLDDDLLNNICKTIAGIGDENAARIISISKGSASVDAISKCRLFISRQLYQRKFPALFSVISNISKASASELNPRLWGESFASALPTPFDIFDLVNLSNEPLREIQSIYAPLIAPMTQSASDMEQWWSKLDAMSMTIPCDNGLARAIERLLISHTQLLRFDSGDFSATGLSEQAQDDTEANTADELYLARRLIRHIQDNAHYYAGQIFAGQPHRRRIEMLKSAINIKAPEVRHEAFDFNQVRVCGANIIIGINPVMIKDADTFLKKLNKGPALKSELSVNVPVAGVCVRGRNIKLGT